MAFHCLARAIYAMHAGNEDLKKDRWDRDEIVHFDLKSMNGKSESLSLSSI